MNQKIVEVKFLKYDVNKDTHFFQVTLKDESGKKNVYKASCHAALCVYIVDEEGNDAESQLPENVLCEIDKAIWSFIDKREGK